MSKQICILRLPSEIFLILHETPGARYSLIPGDLTGFKLEKIKFGEYTTIGIRKQVMKWNVQKEDKACKTYEPTDSQAKCYIEKVMLKRHHDDGEVMDCHVASTNETTLACMIPQNVDVLKLVENSTFKECTSKEEYECMITRLTTLSDERDEICPKPCEEISFKTTIKSVPTYSTYTVIVMKYEENRIDVLEEYLIFDLNAIVSAVGGSLGLFLGFSFFQFGSMLMTNLKTLLYKLFTRHL